MLINEIEQRAKIIFLSAEQQTKMHVKCKFTQKNN